MYLNSERTKCAGVGLYIENVLKKKGVTRTLLPSIPSWANYWTMPSNRVSASFVAPSKPDASTPAVSMLRRSSFLVGPSRFAEVSFGWATYTPSRTNLLRTERIVLPALSAMASRSTPFEYCSITEAVISSV